MTKKHIHLIPLYGILLFFVLYAFASTKYPGGSQDDWGSTGFDWVHNYWCDLINTEAMNGLANGAQPYAIVAMVILCCSLGFFFWRIPKMLEGKGFWPKLAQLAGVASMGLTLLIFSPLHDHLIGVASFVGLFALIALFVLLYRLRWFVMCSMGIFCMLLMVFNNYIYYSRNFVNWLPLIQKITFLIVLFWFAGLNWIAVKKLKTA